MPSLFDQIDAAASNQPPPLFDQIDAAAQERGPSLEDQIDQAAQAQGFLRDKANRFVGESVRTTGQTVAGAGSLGESSAHVIDRLQDWLTEKIQGFPLTDEQRATRTKLRGEASAKYGQPSRALQQSGKVIQELADFYKADPSRDADLSSMVAQGAGSLPVVLASGPAAPVTVGLMMGEQGKQDAVDQGVSKDQQATSFLTNAPLGLVSEYALGLPAILRSVEREAGRSVARRIFNQLTKGFAREAGQEGIEQLGQNVIAKDVAKYDTARTRTAGVGTAMLVGGLVGGPVSAGIQSLTEADRKILDRATEKYLKARGIEIPSPTSDDTGRNIPERPEDLRAQQAQLRRGDRAVQMFPLGTTELPLPEGMQRVETPRGTFHFDPRRMTADEILSKSQAGRENELLGLGPYNKADVLERAKAGEPTAILTERGPHGEELRGAIVTPGTEPATRQAMEQGRSADSRLSLEPLQDAMAQRQAPPSIDDMLEQANRAKRQQMAETLEAERDRRARQAEAQQKRDRFDAHLGNAASVATNPEADYPALQGAMVTLQGYLEDNSLGLTSDQRAAAQTILQQIEPRHQAAKQAVEQQQDARMVEQARILKAEQAAQRERVRAEQAAVREQEAAGIGPTGQFDYQNAAIGLLEQRAEQGDQRAAEAIMRREQEAELRRDDGEELMQAVARIGLPTPESAAAMGQAAEWADMREELPKLRPGQKNWFRHDDGEHILDAYREAGFPFESVNDLQNAVLRSVRGERIVAQPRDETGPDDVAFARTETSPLGFHDNILESLATWQNKGTPDQLRAHLAKTKGTKEYAEWIDLDKFLQGKASVTKQDVQDFVQENRVQVSETVLPNEKGQQARSRVRYDYSHETKFAQYTLPGGENYRELLLTLPYKQTTLPFDGWLLEKTGKRFEDTPLVERDAIREQYLAEKEGRGNFQSQHFDRPNIIAHVRFDERTAPDGARVLFIEEIQSDWHQKGAKHGYGKSGNAKLSDGFRMVRVDATIANDYDMEEGNWTVIDGSGEPVVEIDYDGTLTEQQAINAFVEDASDAGADLGNHMDGRVPDAPFKKNSWPRLALKRMIRWAAEKGFDRIAWTTGQQQAERYDLSKQVDAISARRLHSGNYDVMALKGGEPINLNTDQGRNIAPADLDDFIGKELAERIRNEITQPGQSGVFKGDDLRVGGQGMRTFYDKLLPNIANELAKKYGSKVQQAEAGVSRENLTDQDHRNALDEIINSEVSEADADGDTPGLSQIQESAARIRGAMDEGIDGRPQSYMNAVRQERRLGNRSAAATVDRLVVGILSNRTRTTQQHVLEIPAEMKTAVLDGQPLFARGTPQAADPGTLDDFEARLRRIAPGLLARYRVLVGDPQLLRSVVGPNVPLTGTEQAAHLAKRRILWFLQNNVRADRNGLMPERTRRDVLHETAHAWLDSLEADTQADLQDRWQADLADPKGWLATMRQRRIKLRAGTRTDWKEYWSERMAEENDRWARRRESTIARPPSVLRQLAHEFRTWLEEALDLLRAVFTRTKRYSIDFRQFLDQKTQYAPLGAPVSAARQDFAKGQQTDNPAFRRWFGNSKVVDEQGQPLVVYHGTTRKKVNYISPRHAMEVRETAWFSDSEDLAAEYTLPREYGESIYEDEDGNELEAGSVVPAYLKIENPLVVDFEGDVGEATRLTKLVAQAKAAGHDGLIINNVDDGIGSSGPAATSYAIFDSNQVKHATENRGSFDPENPDIRFAREERTSADIEQEIQTAQDQVEALKESNEPQEDIEQRGADLMARIDMLRRELRTTQQQELANALINPGSALEQAAPAPTQQPAGADPQTAPTYERLDAKLVEPTLKRGAEARIKQWIDIMPAFQVGKYQMAVDVGALIEQTSTPEQRAKIDTVVDYFGGGGFWGAYLALTHYPNTKQLQVWEYEPRRAAKIALLHRAADRVPQLMESPAVQSLLEQVTEIANLDNTTSGTAVAARLNKLEESTHTDPELQAMVGLLADAAINARGRAVNEEGKKTADATVDKIKAIALRDAADAAKGMAELRRRNIAVEVKQGSAYDQAATKGDNVLTVADPPYYLTSGYDGGRVPLGLYLQTGELLQRSAAAGNAVLYTDSAWHIDSPQLAEKTIGLGTNGLPQDEWNLGNIVDSLNHFAIVRLENAGKKNSTARHELVGINLPAHTAGAAAIKAANAPLIDQHDGGDGINYLRPDQAAATPDAPGKRVAAGDARATRPVSRRSARKPAGDLVDRKDALYAELSELNRRIGELEGNPASRRAFRHYLGQRAEVRATLDSEFDGWRKEQPQLAAGEPLTIRPGDLPITPTASPEAIAARQDAEGDMLAKIRHAEEAATGSPAQAAALRQQLAALREKWREQGLIPPPPTEPPTVDELPGPDEDPGPAPQDEYKNRAHIYDEVEGHTTNPPGWLERKIDLVKRSLQGVRGAIPELPAFADDKAQQFTRLRLGYKMMSRGTPRVWKEASDQVSDIIGPLFAVGKFDAKAYDRLGQLQARRRKLRAQQKTVPQSLADEIASLRSQVDREPYGLFQNLALYLDLKWRAENLSDNQGNPIMLPGGVNPAEVDARLTDLKTKLAASPHRELILRALQQHQNTVAAIADDLKARDFTLPDELRNPFYFPHVVLEKDGKQLANALERVRMDTAEDFRGYLQKPVGSTRPIESDYAKAMYYHHVAVGSHNLRADVANDYWKPYDEMQDVRAAAKDLAKKYGRAVGWREAFHTQWKDRGYALFYPDDKMPLHPELTIDRDTLARHLGAALSDAPLQEQLKQLHQQGIRIRPEDIREALAAGEREVWVVPETVAEALNGILRRDSTRSENFLSAPFLAYQNGWKRNILFAPWNYFRYEYNNTMADLEKLWSADPKVYSYLSTAASEVRQFIEDGKGTDDVRAAFRLGVLDTITANEIGDLSALRQFEALQSTKQKWTRQLARRASTLFIGGNRSTLDVSRLREATFRFAKFKADMERMRAGARPVYAGAYWRDIEAIRTQPPAHVTRLQAEIRRLEQSIADRERMRYRLHGAPRQQVETAAQADRELLAKAKTELEQAQAGATEQQQLQAAAEISLATFGDYHNISVAGNELRRYLVPFYSWIEINFRYHANLLRNLHDMVAAKEVSQAEAAKSVGKAATTFATRAATGVLLRLAIPYLVTALWNGTGWRRELEDTLSEEDKRRFHIIIGVDDQGKTKVIYAQTALGDIGRWFSGQEGARLALDVARGRTTVGTATQEFLRRFPRDFVNNLWKVGPVPRAFVAAAFKQSTFPDITDTRTIPASEVKWAVLQQMTDDKVAEIIRRATDKDYLSGRDLGDWASQIILQVRRRDPEQWSYYGIREKADDFIHQKTGQSRDMSYDAPDQQVLRNFRRSIYRGDVPNAIRFYNRLLDLGYTAERFQSSIRAQDPLSGLAKKNDLRREFVESLSPVERKQLQQAYRYYYRMSELRGAERALFPGANRTEASRARYQPRNERLEQEITQRDRLTDDEINQRADRELRRSLR